MNRHQRQNTEAVRAPAVAVQPFGLTNFQSKIVGPLVSSGWRTLRGWNPSTVRRVLGDVINLGTTISYDQAARIAFSDARSGSIRRHRSMDSAGTGSDQASPTGLVTSQSPVSAHRSRSGGSGSGNGGAAPFLTADGLIGYDQHKVTDALNALVRSTNAAFMRLGTSQSMEEASLRAAEMDDELRFAKLSCPHDAWAVNVVANPPVRWLPFTPEAGFAFERAASVAICGFELLFPAVNEALLAVVADNTKLQAVLDLLGHKEKAADYHRHGFLMRSYREGSRLGVLDERVKTQLLANVVSRRIIVITRSEAVMYEPNAPTVPRAAERAPPIVFWRHQVGFLAPAQPLKPQFISIKRRSTGEVVRGPIDVPGDLPTEYSLPEAALQKLLADPDRVGPHSKSYSWFGEDFPPSAFALHCRHRIYHVEIAVSKVRANQQREALVQAPGFGLDHGAKEYLKNRLPSCLVPLHVDADGHCLAHSISRCLIGKEYLWHTLRIALFEYMKDFKKEFEDFFKANDALSAIVGDELDDVVARANPDYEPPQGSGAHALSIGLGAEHVFAFANMLRRPIVLFDGNARHKENYIFLPLLPNAKANLRTKYALGVAWYSGEHCHYVPVVPDTSTAMPVEITMAHLPVTNEGLPLVYGLVGGAGATALTEMLPNAPSGSKAGLRATSSTSGAPVDPPAPPTPWLLEIGGDDEQVSRSLGEYATGLFEKAHRANIWCVHEVARAAAVSFSPEEFDALFTNPRISDLAVTCIKKLRSGSLEYCEECTGTSFPNSFGRCSVCNTSKNAGRRISEVTGAFDLSDGAHTTLHADPEIVGSTNVFKQWIRNGGDIDAAHPPAKGTHVFARESASAHSTALVLDSYYDVLTGHPVVDVQFVAGNACRYAVPLKDILNGYPVDVRVERELDLSPATRIPSDKVRIPVVVDAHEPLCTKPAEVAALVMRKYRVHDSDPIKAALVEKLERTIERIRAGEAGPQATAKTPQHSGGRPGGAEPDEALHAERWEHAQQELQRGALISWENWDPRLGQWIGYEDLHSATIESAYVTAQPTVEIDIPGYGVYTVDFTTMRQYDAYQRVGREVRRTKSMPYSCPICTLDNDAVARTCAACESPRPAESFAVTRDVDTARKEKETAVYRDPRLGEGGALYELAEGAPLRYFRDYGETPFILVGSRKRYYPLTERIGPEHPAFEHLCALEKLAPVVVARPPFNANVILFEAGEARFVRDRSEESGMKDNFVCSLFGRYLKTANFLDFAFGDSALHGPYGAFFIEGEEQQRVNSGITFPSGYGKNLFFMRSDRSDYGGSFYVAVSKTIRSNHPLHADLKAHVDLLAKTGRLIGYQFEFQGWRIERQADGHFVANGTVASSERRPYY
jgi:hypothetical protein